MKRKIKLSTGFWWIVVIVMGILMIVGMFSCNTSKQFNKTMAKANSKRPGMVLSWYDLNYPRTPMRDDSTDYLAALRAMDSIQKRQQVVYDSLDALLQETDGKLAVLESDTTGAGKDEKLRLLSERSDLLQQQLAACKETKPKRLPPVIRPFEDSSKIRVALLKVQYEHARGDSLQRVNAGLHKRVSLLEMGETGTRKTNKVLWWVAGAGILGTVLMGFIGTKGGWVVALIKGTPKIIQLFKKK